MTKKFKRNEKIELTLIENALYKRVIKDAHINITTYKIGGKFKAYCDEAKTYTQFPRKLRYSGAKYIADVIEQSQEGKKTFFSAVKGTIRPYGSNVVIA